ncbi:MAG: tripartite tricarboxylate transporter TctB family protein [Rubrivivax sp.]|nr:tripartite tricarboxylate transporter TctB family protein [Rubrivivax sp.]
MQKTDRWLGLALALLAGAVLWSARDFPAVPGQKVGAGFLPTLVGIGLLLCGLGLVLRSLRAGAYAGEKAGPAAGTEHFGSSAVVVGAVVAYIALADRIGFLLLAPLCLLAVFKALKVRTPAALLWALVGTLVVHVTFYKLLRVPLPWGLLRPLY